MERIYIWLSRLALLLLLEVTVAHAQTARITGQVADPQDAVVRGAQIQVLNLDTNTRLSTQTSESGQYTVPYLPAGHYVIDVQAEGFGTSTSPQVTLGVGQVYIYNVKLGLIAVQSQVSVEANSIVQLETQNAEMSGTITGKEVTGLQLNGRNYVQFIDLVPGVSNQTQQDEAKVGQAGSVAYSVNGGRTEYNSFSVDGSETLNTGLNKDHSTLIVTPSIDAIQEINILTSNYGAQYPSTGNGTTIVTTKSGTDAYHGELYEFVRNEMLNSKGYFDVTKGAPLYRRNDFGGTVGGPLSIPHLYDAKGKTHFFFSEEARIEKSPTAYRQAVPSLSERNDDFTDVCPSGNIYSQFLQPITGFNRSQYPDCPVISNGDTGFVSGHINRNAIAILNTGVIPYPNATLGCNSTIGSCYNVDVSLPTYWREELFRIDHVLNSKYQASFRYIHDEWDETTPVPPYGFVQNSFPTIQSRYYAPGTSLVARLTGAMTPTWLNEFVVSYTNSRIKLTDIPAYGVSILRPAALSAPCAADPNDNVPNQPNVQCPMTTIFSNGGAGLDGAPKMPGIVIAGNNAAYGGTGFSVDPGYVPWSHTNPTYSIADNMTKTLGRHNMQFGAEWIIFQRNEDNTPIGAATGDAQGIATFNNVKGGWTGNSFADFLYWWDTNSPDTPGSPGFKPDLVSGGVSSFEQDSGQARYRQRYQVLEPYIQDDYKIRPHLTLNAGLRISMFGTYSTVNRNAYNWNDSYYSSSTAATLTVDSLTGVLTDKASGDPIPLNPVNPQASLDPRVLNGLVRCGTNGIPSSCMKGHLFNPSPRAGFAWDLFGDGKTALRGGYGIFFEHGTADEANTGSLEGSSPVVLDMTALDPLSWSAIGRNAAYPLNVTAIPTKAVWAYIQQWSFSVERELTRNTLATFAYVGSKGTHLTTERQLNQLQPIASSNNPFPAGRPLIRSGYNPSAVSYMAGDCSVAGSGFSLLDRQTIGLTSPVYVNMQAACFGTQNSNGSTITTNPLAANPNSLRQFAPGIGEIYSLENIANSAYNGFQVTARHVSRGTTLGAAYTYSHSLDDASDRSDTTFVNAFNMRSNHASSNFDQRHLLHISYIYDLPIYCGLQRLFANLNSDPDSENHSVNRPPSSYLTSRLGKPLADGWQLSGITLFETGIPFTVVNNGSPGGVSTLDNAGVANGTGSGSYPDLSGISAHSKRPSAGKNSSSVGPLLLNPEAFVAPRGLTFGNSGRNALNNPRRTNWDIAVLKSIPLHEALNLQFRAEAFNVFNQTQFRIYDPTLGNQSENTVSCYGGAAANYSAGGGDGIDCLTGTSFLHPVDAHRPRTMQLALKLNF